MFCLFGWRSCWTGPSRRLQDHGQRLLSAAPLRSRHWHNKTTGASSSTSTGETSWLPLFHACVGGVIRQFPEEEGRRRRRRWRGAGTCGACTSHSEMFGAFRSEQRSATGPSAQPSAHSYTDCPTRFPSHYRRLMRFSSRLSPTLCFPAVQLCAASAEALTRMRTSPSSPPPHHPSLATMSMTTLLSFGKARPTHHAMCVCLGSWTNTTLSL